MLHFVVFFFLKDRCLQLDDFSVRSISVAYVGKRHLLTEANSYHLSGKTNNFCCLLFLTSLKKSSSITILHQRGN